MELKEYKTILMETITNEYPLYFQKTLLKKFQDKGLIFRDGRKTNVDNLLDVTCYSKERDQLKLAIESMDNCIKECEEFEYEKGYRYCAIFKFRQYNENIVNKLVNEKQIFKYNENNIFDDNLYEYPAFPTYKENGDYAFLKFGFMLNNKEETNSFMKYPVLVVINKKLKIIEIRLDTVSFKYKNKENFYEDKIGRVKSWIRRYLDLSIEDIDFQAVTKYMRSNKADEVTITALKMVRDGMVASLDACSNEEMTIPILGELKELILKCNTMFVVNDDTIKIKELLNNFIKKIEETSDLPSVKIFWHIKRIKLLVMHSYKEKSYSLFKYSDELEDKERMNYVTNYLVECEEELRKQFQIEQ
ncbi:hypothetical protein [Clostridium felsineum]|uniref:Uncharacterized protein n=1 Tax=Clostridium felsineum TaxID=36839 RepID=A0A1S8KZQ5_9CLOT|nr:hypothetical protein [Clostridium felsineum]URZ06501.1 hypothetical protein CLROS_018340 [Clostridium felsineum]URZ11536.1 hypothetical protein CROST_022530 [Clostridium felsineum]